MLEWVYHLLNAFLGDASICIKDPVINRDLNPFYPDLEICNIYIFVMK